jgi:hypothetical protein
MNYPPVPTHWSPEQALAVCEYLQQLSEQIWAHYRLPMIELIGPVAEQALRPTSPSAHPAPIDRWRTAPPDFDDDLPF